MYTFHQIGLDFAFCTGLRFFSRSRKPEIEGLLCLSSEITTSKSATVHLVCVIIMYTLYETHKDVASFHSSHTIFLKCWGSLEVALLTLVEMGTAPPIVPGCDTLQPVIRFSHRHVYSDICSCLIEKHRRTVAVICLSCACKRAVWIGDYSVLFPSTSVYRYTSHCLY